MKLRLLSGLSEGEFRDLFGIASRTGHRDAIPVISLAVSSPLWGED
jgi:hypothetical protein